MRKSFLWTLLAILMVAGLSVSVTSCGDDDGDPTSGKWNLVSYDGTKCTHGEYMKFSKSKCNWNNRLGGRNTTYNCRVSGSTFYLTNASDGSGNVTFYIKSSSDKSMVTESSDGILRHWKR